MAKRSKNKQQTKSIAEVSLAILLTVFDLPFEREFMFNKGASKHRADFAILDKRVLLEVEGGTYGIGKACRVCRRRASGRHTSGAGFEKDCTKYNLAALAGWQVFRIPSQWLAPKNVKENVTPLLRRIASL